nr:helix-turn-helix domain-containing protein [Oleiagrimonas soli]
MHAAPATARIGAIVRDSEVSQKRFGRLFREHLGLGPKRYVRLLRFRRLIDTAHVADDIDWAALAADCGFHDQPHLVREFRAFAGMTPSAYATRRGPHLNHVAV